MKHTELKMKNLRWETVILKINIENETGCVLKGKNTNYENNSRNIDVSLPDYLSLKSFFKLQRNLNIDVSLTCKKLFI
jgi:long-subunit fatty acid transport protein